MQFEAKKLILGIALFSVLYSFSRITANVSHSVNETSFSAEPAVKTWNTTLIEDLNATRETPNIINEKKVQVDKYDGGGLEQKGNTVKSTNITSKVFKSRVPVKLTMKQGLIMNQVLNTYGLTEVKNKLCKNHTEEFKAALRAFEPWALKMFDASSKLMAGILNGNLAEVGSYWQCLYIYEETQYGPIRGKHCAFKVTPSDKLLKVILSYRNVSEKRFKILKPHVLNGTQLIWSVCVPDSCPYKDVFRHYNKTIMEAAQGLHFTISLKESNCQTLMDFPSLTTGDYLFMVFVSGIFVTVAMCTVIDFCFEESTNTFVDLFSVRKNGKLLFSANENKTELSCLHGIRFLSMFYIVVGHRFEHNFGFPLANSMELVEWVLHYFSTLVFGGTVSVDTFMLLASTVTSYNFFLFVNKTNHFNLFQFYLYRNLRMLMPLLVVVFTYATVIKYFGSGPFYHDFYMSWQVPCEKFWWSALLHMQGFFNPRNLCVAQIWYLSVDMFWYYVSPIVLIPLWKNKIFGYISFITVYMVSVAISFYVAWIWDFDAAVPVSKELLFTDYLIYHYIQPLTRGSPYVLGLGFGYALFRTKAQDFHMNRFTKIFGWTLSITFLATIILINHAFHVETYKHDRLFSSLFLSCNRSVWTLAMIWVIWSCETGNGGIVHAVLSQDIFKILSRLNYNIFLWHYILQAGMAASQKVTGYFSDFIMIHMAISDMVLSCLISIVMTLCFEYPFTRMIAIFFQSENKQKIHPNVKKIETGTFVDRK